MKQYRNNYKDLIGKNFGRLIPKEYAKAGKYGTRLKCDCSCGGTKVVYARDLINRSTSSCGCINRERSKKAERDIIGIRSGKLTVTKFAYRKDNDIYFECICDCGTKTIVKKYSLKKGETKSCGCLHLEMVTTHGFSTSDDPLKVSFYKVWRGMLSRCYDKKAHNYPLYGGRGIKVCDRWLKFENFRDDMWEEYRRRKLAKEIISIHRLKNNKNYKPSNCVWATPTEQSMGRRNSVRSSNYKNHVKKKKQLYSLIESVLKGQRKVSKQFEYYVGCTPEKFREHIQSRFLPGMTWDNYGRNPKDWGIDHILSCNQFDFTIELDILLCFNYRNLRPYWQRANSQRNTTVFSI